MSSNESCTCVEHIFGCGHTRTFRGRRCYEHESKTGINHVTGMRCENVRDRRNEDCPWCEERKEVRRIDEEERKEKERTEMQKTHARTLSKDGLLSVDSAKTKKDRDGDDGGSDSDILDLKLPANMMGSHSDVSKLNLPIRVVEKKGKQ